MNKILAVALTLALLCALALPTVPTLPALAGGPPEGVPHGKPEQLERGWHRVSPHITAHTLRTATVGGKRYATVEAEIASYPTTLKDNKTLIDTNWYLVTDGSGQTYFQSGVNLFTAKVLDGRVSVEDDNGRLSVWDSRVTIGSEAFFGGTPKITDDPIESSLKGNCLVWEYGSYSNGWWIFGSSAKVKRYLRITAGHIEELWILPIDPKASVYVSLGEIAEPGFGAQVDWLNAYDARGKPLKATKNMFGTHVINATEFVGKTYPVTIDPTENFILSYAADELWLYGDVDEYWEVRNATWGLTGPGFYGPGAIGQAEFAGYEIYRFAIMFDTSALPDNADIQSAMLKLAGHSYHLDWNFYIVIQSGMPTYPHVPAIQTDYYYLNYSGNGGQYWSGGWSIFTINNIVLNSTGISWINKEGWTKFLLRSSNDINGVAPWYDEEEVVCIDFYPSSPTLSVTYSIPVEVPTVSTLDVTSINETYATFKGYLDDDGTEACSVRFKYTPYGSAATHTAWVSGYTTGQYFDKIVYGLTPGKEVAVIAQASNSAGEDDGDTKYFTPYPRLPSNFTATGEEDQIALTWTKGTGAYKTMIRRAEGSYPTSPTGGTQIYYDTGVSHDDTTTVNGVTYYYSAWSWAPNEYTSGGVYSQVKADDYAVSYTLGKPTVTTNDATDVETTTATLNLYLDDLGGYATTNVWFQYGPTVAYGETTTPTQKTAPGAHSAGLTSLSEGETYHFRAAAQNTAGTVYGVDKSFVMGMALPVVTTNAATVVGYESATLNLTLTDDGGESCEVSFEYGLTTSYGTTTEWVPGYSTSQGYSKAISGLDSNETYHFRARARNNAGTGYGSDQQFDTESTPPSTPTAQTNAADDIGYESATLHGKVLSDGGEACQVRFQYGETTAYGTDTAWVNGKTTDDLFSKPIVGLDPDTTYHFRAQVKNSAGTANGADAQFDTTAVPPSLPTVVTNDATAAGSSTATLHGTLSNDGNEACQVRFEYGYSTAYGTYTAWQDGFTTTDTFQQAIVDLSSETTYHYRAIAMNSAGTSYGSDVTFATGVLPPCAPTMLTQSPTGVQLTSVTLRGKVSADGNAPVTVWFEYGLTTAYEIGSTPTTSGLSTNDTFYYNLGNLTPTTTYHYRAVGENSAGTGYGSDVEFATATPTAPTSNTNEATEVGSNQATLQGTLNSDGGVPCEVRFQYGTTEAYGTDTGWQTEFTSGMNFSQFISNLTIGETYHFRAQANNAGGTTSGSDRTFTTKFAPPTDFSTTSVSSNTISLAWHKAGDQTYIRYKQTGFPIDREDGLSVYFGPAEEASVSGLLPGVTYYFRAWSWREGNVWAEGYAEDVATTQPTAAGVTEERPEGVLIPPEPGGWFNVPSGAALTKLPMYQQFVAFGASFGMPEGSMWLAIGMVLTIMAAAAAFMVSRKLFVAVVFGGLTISTCSVLGMMPLWFIAIYAVLGGGFAYTLGRASS